MYLFNKQTTALSTVLIKKGLQVTLAASGYQLDGGKVNTYRGSCSIRVPAGQKKGKHVQGKGEEIFALGGWGYSCSAKNAYQIHGLQLIPTLNGFQREDLGTLLWKSKDEVLLLTERSHHP